MKGSLHWCDKYDVFTADCLLCNEVRYVSCFLLSLKTYLNSNVLYAYILKEGYHKRTCVWKGFLD